MANIRVNPDILDQSSGSISSAGQGVKRTGDDVWRSAKNAPSYNGQFGPQVRAIAQSALAQAQGHQIRLADRSVSLNNRAHAFRQADIYNPGIVGTFTSKFLVPPPDKPEILGTSSTSYEDMSLSELNEERQKLNEEKRKLLEELLEELDYDINDPDWQEKLKKDREHYEKVKKMLENGIKSQEDFLKEIRERKLQFLDVIFLQSHKYEEIERQICERIKKEKEKLSEFNKKLDALNKYDEIAQNLERVEQQWIQKLPPSQSPFKGGFKETGSFGVYQPRGKPKPVLHNGIDIWPANSDKNVYPIGPGKVVKVGEEGTALDGGLGNNIDIEHKLSDGRTIISTYAHLESKPNYNVGDSVNSDSHIGVMGKTGGKHITGEHLHLTVHEKGNKTDTYLKNFNNPVAHPINEFIYDNGIQVTREQEMRNHWIDPNEFIDPAKASEKKFIPTEFWSS